MGFNADFITGNFHIAADNAFLFYAMDIEFAFGPHAVFAICGKIQWFNDFPGKIDARVFAVFHIVFVEMLQLQRTIESGKGGCFYRPGEAAVGGVDGAAQFGAAGFDGFQSGFGVKINLAVVASVMAICGGIQRGPKGYNLEEQKHGMELVACKSTTGSALVA